MNFPILSAIIFIPLIGALFILITRGKEKNVEKNSKNVAIFSSFANFFLSLLLWFLFDTTTPDFQFVENKNWIDGFINFQLGIDGISILFILLTTFITPICIFSGIQSRYFRNKICINFIFYHIFYRIIFCPISYKHMTSCIHANFCCI